MARSRCLSHIGAVRSAILPLLLVGCSATPAPVWDLPSADRIVAVGDVHGSFDNLVVILARVGLIDDERQWIGGKAVLVQTGDLLGRGRNVRRVLDLLMELQATAPRAGGRVIVLWGNHEVANLAVDPFDVSAETLASFLDEQSDARRKAAMVAWQSSFSEPPGPELERAWLTRHPPGIFAYLEALSPEGLYGRWLRNQAVVARVGDSLFVHGGIHPSFTGLDPAAINERALDSIHRIDRHRRFLVDNGLLLPATRRDEVVAFAMRAFATLPLERRRRLAARVDKALNEIRSLTEGGVLFGDDSPCWFRGYTTFPDDRLAYLPVYLERLRVRRVVVGHTPQPSANIGVRLGGRILLIDTGMQPMVYERGRPAALEIRGPRVEAIYDDGRRVLGE